MRGVSLRNAFVRLNSVEQIGRDGGKGCVCPFFRPPTADGRRENSSRAASMPRRSTSMWSAFRFPPRPFTKPFPLSTFLPRVPTVAPHGVVPLSFMVQDDSSCSRGMDAMDHSTGTTSAAVTALFSPRLPQGMEGVSHRPSEDSGGETCAGVSSSCGGPPHGRGHCHTPSRAMHGLPVMGRCGATPLAPSCGHSSGMRNAFYEPHRWRSGRMFSPSLEEQQRRHTGKASHSPEAVTLLPHPEMEERRRGDGEAAAGDHPLSKHSQAEQGMVSSTVQNPRAAPSTSANASPFLLPFPAIVKACRQGTLGVEASLAPSCVVRATRQQKKRKKKEEEEDGVSLPPPPAPDETIAPHDPPWRIASASAFSSASHAAGRPAAPLASSSDPIDHPWEKWPVTPQEEEEEETWVPRSRGLASHSLSLVSSLPHQRLLRGEKAPWQEDGHSTRVSRATTGTTPSHTSSIDQDDPLSWLSESDTSSTAPPFHSDIIAEEVEDHHEEEEVGQASSAVPVQVGHEANGRTTEDSLSHCTHSTDASMHEWENDDETESHWKRKQKATQKKGKWWIFNRFSRRVVSASSPTLQDLSHLLGIDPCPLSRQLVLQRPAAIESFTRALQAKDISWPAGWRSSEFFRLRRLLEHTDVSAVIPKVQAFLSEKPPDASLRTSALVSEKRTEEVEETAPKASRKEAMSGNGRRPCRPNNGIEADARPVEKDQERRVTDPVADELSTHHIPFSPSNSTPLVPTIVKERLFSEADLTEEQRSVVELALRGHHLYIGGSAGTGKSVLLRVLRRRLGEEGLSVAVTATTGLAAYHIGGTTLHHRFGITLDGRFLRPKALQEYDVIIIDEVSMLSRIVFEELECQMRRVHRNALPFGGVQIILCGDFMQLGAISAPSLVQSPLFRHFFVMLKLMRSLRQEKNIGFYIHLQALRQGKMLPTWGRTVQFMDSYGHKNVRENFSTVPSEQEGGEKKRSTSDSADAAPGVEKASPLSSSPSTSSLSSKVIFLPPLSSSSHLPEHLKDEKDPLTHGTSSSSSSSSSSISTARPVTPPIIVEDAVNLLPTNALVRQANEVMLEKIEGEVVQFQSMALPPFLQGKWSPSYLLRVSPSASADRPSASKSSLFFSSSASPSTPEETSNPVSTVDRAALLQHLQRFVLSCLSPFSSDRLPPTSLDEAESGVENEDEVDDKGSDVEEWQSHPERHMVLYPLYNDGFVFRVRLPTAWNGSPAKEAAFVSSLTDGLGDFLDTLDMGVHRGDVLPSGEGLHTDQDEFYLQQLTLRSPMAEPLVCKIGAKVMLRANLSRTLVNGSLGTIVGFVEMKKEELSSYLQHLLPSFRCHEGASETAGGVCHPYEASLEASIEQYADFLRFEHNFTTPLMPLVDFSGDGSTVPMAIPPVMFPVGGMDSTHYYAGGVLRLPLSLAYAFTVHKVQGLTLSGRVHLELSQMWPCEHLLYVAMSRVKDPDQLSVSNFRMDVVRVGADCLLFDRSLPSVDHAKILPHFIPAVWVTDPRKRKRLLQRQRGRERRRRKREKEDEALSSFSVLQSGRRGRRQLARDIHMLQERALVKLHRKDLRAGHATL